MKLHWLAIGLLSVSTALLAQYAPPPQSQNAPPQQENDGPADEPGRAVARLAILNGDASVRRGDAGEWVAAAVNAPLMSGDQISVAAGGRAEIQLDAAHFLRVSGDTELRLADLDNGHYQIQISHGLVTWRVLRDTQIPARNRHADRWSSSRSAIYRSRRSRRRRHIPHHGTQRRSRSLHRERHRKGRG